MTIFIYFKFLHCPWPSASSHWLHASRCTTTTAAATTFSSHGRWGLSPCTTSRFCGSWSSCCIVEAFVFRRPHVIRQLLFGRHAAPTFSGHFGYFAGWHIAYTSLGQIIAIIRHKQHKWICWFSHHLHFQRFLLGLIWNNFQKKIFLNFIKKNKTSRTLLRKILYWKIFFEDNIWFEKKIILLQGQLFLLIFYKNRWSNRRPVVSTIKNSSSHRRPVVFSNMTHGSSYDQ